MKYILAMILVIASLISTASAVGNYISQSNDVYASGSGTATISSSQDNVGVIVGDYNTLIQSNDADLYNSAVDSAIALTQNNAELIVGDWNTVHQDNLAWAENYGGEYNLITETQSNMGMIVGNENYASQSNAAWSQINGGYYNTIIDTQSNTGLQVGDWNSLIQSNAKMNDAYYWEEYWDSDGYYSYYDYSYPVVGSVINDGTFNTIAQTQSNVGAQVGTGNYMSQQNDAKAEIDYGYADTINQDQSNTGLQVGDYNRMYQNNFLKNYEYYWQSGYNVYDWGYWYDYWSGSSYPVPGALITDGYYSTIDQTQSNVGAQIGVGNVMDQLNDAKADMSYSDSSIITQDQSNTGLQVGDYNWMDQENWKKTYGYDSGSYYWEEPGYGYGYSWWSDEYPVAGDLIYGGLYSTITDTQNNVGAQIGTYNDMYQYNYAHAENNNAAWFSDIVQTQTNLGLEVGEGNDLYQNNYVYAYNGGDYNDVLQTESNLAAIIGVGEYAWQNNEQYAYPDSAWFDDADVITQDASNLLLMVGSYDVSQQTNYQYASQSYDSSTPIDQDASNDNVVLS